MEIAAMLCWFSAAFAVAGVLALLWLDVWDAAQTQPGFVSERTERYETEAAALMAWELAPEVKALKSVIEVCLDCGCEHREMAELNEEFYFVWLRWSRYRDLAKPHFNVSY